jgi:hypothetical protein
MSKGAVTNTVHRAVQERSGLGDPRSKYPKPPFQEQKQARPGLSGKMNPMPYLLKTDSYGRISCWLSRPSEI